MKRYKKTLIGSIFAFMVGTSCCWFSSIAVWFSGASILAMLTNHVTKTQNQFILLSVAVGIASFFLYKKIKK